MLTGTLEEGRLVLRDLSPGVRPGEIDAFDLSPDGRIPAPDRPPHIELRILDLATGETDEVVPGWDRWAVEYRWTPDGSALIATADEDGRCPVFVLDPATHTATRITADDAAFTHPRPAADGSLFAIRSSYELPPEVVRIDLTGALATGEAVPAQRLRGVAEPPALPGTLTEIETTADDGARVRAWLALPQGADAEHPAPLLLWVHGGPLNSWNAWTWRWCPWLLVSQGYAVLLPDPALSTGYGEAFIARGWNSWGGKPFTDLMAITDEALRRHDLDHTRTAAMGGSFGGYMANWIAGQTDRFDAIVTHASLWAMDGFRYTTDAAHYWKYELDDQMTLAHSPNTRVAQINTPMLVVHGDKDYRVPIGEGLRLWYELLASSKLAADDDGRSPHRFLYFPDENHWVLSPQHAKVWYQTVSAFLGQHVLGEDRDYPLEPACPKGARSDRS